ncbi:hypothetical protein [Stratiformator vulcanicus]|uniref:hypothetical protein n=1 Tax=Stratiformator vulcanicus TaxID=2527980 RepID=UPI00119CFEA5|nr:hypothetical protein [Stratiformator vulcanicus]
MPPENAPESAPPERHPLVPLLNQLCEELQLFRELIEDLRVDIRYVLDNDLGQPEPVRKSSVPARPALTLFDPGDAVEFRHEGRDVFGEIVSVDDANNRAMVQLIPSMEQVTVCQDDLRHAERVGLKRRAAAKCENTSVGSADEVLAESPQGSLF